MLYHVRNYFLIICTQWTVSCSQPVTKTNISIKAQRIDGSAIALAKVELDGVLLGETNAFGTLKSSNDLKTDIEHSIKVSFEDASYYYSPYKKNFVITKQNPTNVDITAIMYLAPKPKANRILKNSKPLRLTENSKNSTAVSLKPPTASQMPWINLKPSDFIAEKKTRYDDQPPSRQAMFHVHVNSGYTPLENTEVTWKSSSSEEATCSTNARGRCTFSFDKNTKQLGILFIRRSGFQSQLREILPQEHQNYRLNLQAGSTIDLEVTNAGASEKEPASGISVAVNNQSADSTNQFGLTVFPKPATDEIKVELTGDKLTTPLILNLPQTFGEVIQLRLPLTTSRTNPEYLTFHTHAVASQNFVPSPAVLNDILNVLERQMPSARIDQEFAHLDQLSLGQVGILPIMENTSKGIKLTIMMLDKNRQSVISEQIDGLGVDKNTIEKSIAKMCGNLQKRQSKYALIDRVDYDSIEFQMDPRFVKFGEEILISNEAGAIKAAVVKIQNDRITAKLLDAHHLKTPWDLIGSQVSNSQQYATDIHEVFKLAPSLRILMPSLIPLDKAAKYLLENNPYQALKELDQLTDSSPLAEIMKLQESAQAYSQLSQYSAALNCLYRALALAIENNFEVVSSILNVNLYRLKAELLPVLKFDRNLLDALTDFKIETKSLHEKLQESMPNHPLVKITFDYVDLLLAQKIALVTDDNSGLSNMSKAWDSLKNDFEHLGSTNIDTENFNQAIAKARSLPSSQNSNINMKL
jgi:tetratricopeptide (TPR) repeat protein